MTQIHLDHLINYYHTIYLYIANYTSNKQTIKPLNYSRKKIFQDEKQHPKNIEIDIINYHNNK